MFKKIFIFLMVISINGCVFNPQELYFNPKVAIEANNIGHNSKISVSVIDDRSTTVLGYKGSAEGKHAQITSKNELAPTIKREVENGLKAYDFIIVNNSNKKLTIEIRNLDYSTSTGFSSGGVHLKAFIKVYAKNNNHRMEKRYRVEDDKSVGIAPNDATNEKWINETLSKVISKVLKDRELMKFLSK